MRLTVVGCAGSYPGPDSAASAYLVQADDEAGRTWSILLDLGNGAFGPLQKYVEPLDIDAVALTHLHADHYFDMAAMYVYCRYHPDRSEFDEAPVPVFCPFGTASRLADAYGTDIGELSTEFTFTTWQAGTAIRVGPLVVEPQAVEHSIPAYGFRISGPSEADPGKTVSLAYSGDTDLCPNLVYLAQDVELLLAEATFVSHPALPTGIHMTGEDAGRLGADAQVARLVLTHIPGWVDPELVKNEAAAEFDGPIDIAQPGQVYRI
jgi:ribonuclease BN (tRNA processing enzyme)